MYVKSIPDANGLNTLITLRINIHTSPDALNTRARTSETWYLCQLKLVSVCVPRTCSRSTDWPGAVLDTVTQPTQL